MMKDMKALDCLKIMSNPKLTKCHQLHVLKTSQNIFPKMISCDFHLIPTKRNRVRGPAGALPGRPVAPEAATTSSGRPTGVCSARCGTCWGRCPAPRLRRTTGAGAALRCTGGGRRPREILPVLLAAGAEVDARTDVSVSALKRWIHGALGDFRVPKKFERNM